MDTTTGTTRKRPSARELSLWLAIGVLVAAAVLGSVFIIIGDQAAIAGRAWLTLLLSAAFAGAVVLDTALENTTNRWYLQASIGVNVTLVVVGLLKIWGVLLQPADTADALVWSDQLFRFLLIVVLLRGALFLTQVYGPRVANPTGKRVTKVFAGLALGLLWITTVVLALPSALPALAWPDLWWRLLGASTLVTAVLFLIPVIVLAFEPRQQKPEPAPAAPQHPQVAADPTSAQLPWAPTVADR